MNILTTIARFVFLSSADPNKISLTLKGLSIVAIPALMQYFNLDQSTASILFSDILTLTSAVVAGYGLARKILFTVYGANKAL